MTISSILRSKIFSIAALIVLGWMILSVIKVNSHKGLLEERLSDLNDKVEKIENDNTSLQKQIGLAGNEEYLEKEARIKLNYKLPDEEVAFIYSRNEPLASSSMDGDTSVIGEKSSYLKWWDWLWNK